MVGEKFARDQHIAGVKPHFETRLRVMRDEAALEGSLFPKNDPALGVELLGLHGSEHSMFMASDIPRNSASRNG
jgi:hypothetical protein